MTDFTTHLQSEARVKLSAAAGLIAEASAMLKWDELLGLASQVAEAALRVRKFDTMLAKADLE